MKMAVNFINYLGFQSPESGKILWFFYECPYNVYQLPMCSQQRGLLGF